MNTPPWLLIAEQELGVHETPGPKATARIIEYDKATSLKATSDEVPWCAAFVNWCLEQAGFKGTNSAAAASFLDWGEDLGDYPKDGCIVVFEWASGGHHVSFYVGIANEEEIKCLGGNQSDSVKVSVFPTERVASYRWPKETIS